MAATVSSVAGSASSVTLLAVNRNRVSFSVFNDSSAVLYVKLGATASASDYTVQPRFTASDDASKSFQITVVARKSG